MTIRSPLGAPVDQPGDPVVGRRRWRRGRCHPSGNGVPRSAPVRASNSEGSRAGRTAGQHQPAVRRQRPSEAGDLLAARPPDADHAEGVAALLQPGAGHDVDQRGPLARLLGVAVAGLPGGAAVRVPRPVGEPGAEGEPATVEGDRARTRAGHHAGDPLPLVDVPHHDAGLVRRPRRRSTPPARAAATRPGSSVPSAGRAGCGDRRGSPRPADRRRRRTPPRDRPRPAAGRRRPPRRRRRGAGCRRPTRPPRTGCPAARWPRRAGRRRAGGRAPVGSPGRPARRPAR